MFVRRHPWAIPAALVIGTAFSVWLKPSIELVTAATPLRILLYLAPPLLAFLSLYLVIRVSDREALKEYEDLRLDRNRLSLDAATAAVEINRLNTENELLKRRLAETMPKTPESGQTTPPAPVATAASEPVGAARSGRRSLESPVGASGAQVIGAAFLAPRAVEERSEYRQDPIYGLIPVDKRTVKVFRQPIVQRLGRIRQLSFSYLTFPSATHTRLAHSLGVCRAAELALGGVLARNELYCSSSESPSPIPLGREEREELALRCKVAALLHDLGHGPFGHALDKYVGFLDPEHPRLSPDKDYSIEYIRRYLSQTISEIGTNPEGVLRLLDRSARRDLQGFDVFVADLIDSPLDVDRIDYLLRDGMATGLTMGIGSPHSLFEMMRAFASGNGVFLTFDEAALPAIENLLYLRDFMYVNCYEVPEKLAAERAFQRIAEEAISSGLLSIDGLMLLTDDNVLGALLEGGSLSRSITPLAEALVVNQKFADVYSCKTTGSANPHVRDWMINRLAGGVGLRVAYVDLPRLWEHRIAERGGLAPEDHWQVLVSVPSHHAYVQKESGARILVRRDGRFDTVDLFQYSRRLGAILEQMRPASTYVRVFASAQLTEEQRNRLRASASELLS
jgi:HD superfamily phosphohydrolase